MKGPIDKHPHWQLVDELDRLELIYDEREQHELASVFRKSASLIRQLKMENKKHRDDASRLRFPDTTGQ